MGKIPLIGYVLAGEYEDASLSLKISGELDDPEVSNSLVKDIVVYPVEILLRTLKLPIHFAEKFDDEPEEESGESAKTIEQGQLEEIGIEDER